VSCVTQTQRNEVFAFFKELCSSKCGEDQSGVWIFELFRRFKDREQQRTQKRFNERRILRMEDKSELDAFEFTHKCLHSMPTMIDA
jgi:hypothetical protein